jgi:hypothetical protein
VLAEVICTNPTGDDTPVDKLKELNESAKLHEARNFLFFYIDICLFCL